MTFLKGLVDRIREGLIPADEVKNLEDVRRWLRKYGYHRLMGIAGTQVATLSDAQLAVLVRKAQEFLGLTPDSIVGPQTLEAMSMPRCGCPDFRRDTSRSAPQFHDECKLTITTYADFSGLRGLAPSTARDLWFETLKQYEEKINVAFQMVLRKEAALIEAHVGPADRGVLAWMEVFDGCNGQHASRYNRDVVWDEDLFIGTALHENGHGLGIDHSPAGVRSIMAPVHDPSIPAVVDDWLMGQLIPRYGQRTSVPDPVVPEPEPGNGGGRVDKIPPGVWAMIFEWIDKLIQNCASEEAAVAELRNPRRAARMVKVHLWKNRGENKLNREERNAAAGYVVAELENTTQEEQIEYVKMARSA